MTFRADELAAELRIAELEREVSALEGRRLGLEVAAADAEDRVATARARAKRLLRRAGRTAWAGLGLLCGFLVGSTCSGGIPMLLGPLGCADCAFDVDETVDTADGCRATVRGTPGSDCRAQLICEGNVIYDGGGDCGTFFTDQIEYWDHTTRDGTPALVIAEHDGVLAWRDASGTTRSSRIVR